MRITRRALGRISVCGAAFAMFGCGGGGGGAPPATAVGKILLVSTGQPFSGAVVAISGVTFVTQAGGDFRLDNVPSDAKQLTVTGVGVKPLTQAVSLVPAGTTNIVNDLGNVWVLDSASTDGYTATLIGQVVRADTFAPIAGATVIVSGVTTTSDANGSFTIAGLPVGLGTVNPIGVIRANGFSDKLIDTGGLPLGTGNNNLGAIPMVSPAGSTPGLVANIEGTISLQGQADLSGTRVTLINKASGATVGVPQTTGSNGKFGFYVIAGTYTVKAEHAGPPAFTTQTKDVTLDRPDHVQTVNMTLIP